MNDNLGGESFNRKLFRKKLSRTSVRLCGWMKYRIQRSKKPWVHIRLESFCDLTGKSLRTAKRCLNTLRQDNNDLVIRTINQDGVWKVVASTCGRLHGLSRSEPFTLAEDGSKQIVKESIRGKEIRQEQLIVGEDKVYWNAKSKTYDCLATDQEVGGLVEHLTCNEDVVGTNTLDSKSSADLQSASFPQGPRTENPCVLGQMKLDLDVPDSKSGTPKSSTTYARTRMSSQVTISSDSTGSNNDNVRTESWHNRPRFEQRKRECHFYDRTYKGKNFVLQRSKHGDAGSAHKMRNQKMRNFAFYIARNDLRQEHWDNCKIQHTMRHGFNYALQELEKGCNRRTIVKAYQMALRECHGIAVDAGVTEQASWLPSSTINKAKSILAEGDCRGKWWDRIAQESQDVVITA